MKRLLALLLSMAFWCMSPDALAKQHRSSAAKTAFKRISPCPATGRSTGPCPGYIIDHIKPLACGGADAPSNMQWQTKSAAKAKDAWERDDCSVTPSRGRTVAATKYPDFASGPKTTTKSSTGFDGENNRAARANFGARPNSSTYSSGGTGSGGYFRGPRGGCYYMTPGGSKQYVDRSYCN